MWTRVLATGALVVVLTGLMGCSASLTPLPTPTTPSLASELILYDWEDDLPQSVLDLFTTEYGVQVVYKTYESQEEAMANMRAGAVYDVVVFDNDFVPQLVADGLLAEIDYRHVPNFDNISPNFRDLAYDPQNKHTVPFNWGVTALLVRSDLVEEPVTRWEDLWEREFAGKIAVRDEPREPFGMALKSLGYSINSEDPDAVQAAFDHLLEIKDKIVLVGPYAEAAVPMLLSGEAAVLVGWAEDVLLSREESLAIEWVLPEEGIMLWGDNFVIPAYSPRKYTAELFLNFLMRPEVNAQIVNENYYASPNEAARAFIDPEILHDPVIFPPDESLGNAEVFLPLSPDGEQLYQQLWERFKRMME